MSIAMTFLGCLHCVHVIKLLFDFLLFKEKNACGYPRVFV